LGVAWHGRSWKEPTSPRCAAWLGKVRGFDAQHGFLADRRAVSGHERSPATRLRPHTTAFLRQNCDRPSDRP
jgi:hypothetical protein